VLLDLLLESALNTNRIVEFVGGEHSTKAI